MVIKKFFFVLFLAISFLNCESKSKKTNDTNKKDKDSNIVSVEKVTFVKPGSSISANIYVENSGSMFGYIEDGGRNFKNVVSTIAADCDLNFSQVDYYFINGLETYLGSDLASFLGNLTPEGFNAGDPSTSRLNTIFSKVLENARSGEISILISDGIYSVQSASPASLIAQLQTQSFQTRNTFVKRLREENLITYLIKYSSNFNGEFFPAEGGSISINQERPYYVWIFGEEEDINKTFKANYFNELPGFKEIAKFVKLTEELVPCQLCVHGKKGKFKFVKDPKILTLTDVDPDRNRVTSFSIAFDFSQIPLAYEYFQDVEIYENNLGYTITGVVSPDEISPTAQAGLKGNYTHVVTFSKTGPPWGNMKLRILNKMPGWIEQTSIDDDSQIEEDINHTFGFKYLINGISNAYNIVNNKDYIQEYNIKINLD